MTVSIRNLIVAFLVVFFPLSVLAANPTFQVFDDPSGEPAGSPLEVPRISLGLSLGAAAPTNDFMGNSEGGWNRGVGVRLATFGRSHLALTARTQEMSRTLMLRNSGTTYEEDVDLQIYELMHGWNFHGGLGVDSRVVLELGVGLARVGGRSETPLDWGGAAHISYTFPLSSHVGLEPGLSVLYLPFDDNLGSGALGGAHFGIRVH